MGCARSPGKTARGAGLSEAAGRGWLAVAEVEQAMAAEVAGLRHRLRDRPEQRPIPVEPAACA